MLGFAVMFVQAQWTPFKLKPLNGFTPVTEKPSLTLADFASGNYQSNLEQYLSEHFGFREFFIRCYNQLSYSCFRFITNENVIEGADHELFLRWYFDDRFGDMLTGYYSSVDEAKADAQNNIRETLRLIDTLQSHGSHFLFIFAPTKPAVYPEKLPQRYRDRVPNFSLEEYYIELFKENNIPHIDFYSYFQTIKDTVSYPLYARTGTHWAEWTITFVVDSIYRKIESLTGYRMPNIEVVDENCTKEYLDIDKELEYNMNLLFPYPKPALPNPVWALTDTLETDRPNLLITGDSYGGQLVATIFAKAFNNWDLWSYNETMYSSRKRFNWFKLSHEFQAWRVLEEADIVMALFTSPNYYNYMLGFPQIAQELYEKGYFKEDEAIGIVKETILNDSAWYASVVEQANALNLNVEDCLESNARYFLDHLKEGSSF